MASDAGAQVLGDVTNTMRDATLNENMNQEAAQKARAHGWIEPSNYDYEALASTKVEPSTWASNAQKYEWKDEYGDVGPEDEKLEEYLFKNQHIVRKGAKMEK